MNTLLTRPLRSAHTMPALLATMMTTCLLTAPAVLAADNEMQPPGQIGAPAGSGRWPAVAESRADFRTHTLYRPATLPAGALPLLVWGNGGCSDNGLAHSLFLREIASHGYVVIALGHARSEPPTTRATPANPPANPPAPRAGPPPAATQDATDVAQMSEAIVWATARNAQTGDMLYGHIDTSRVAVAGHSCGGLQAIKMSADPRIRTTMIFDSGVYNTPGGRSSIKVGKDELANLHGPIAYFTGGPSDIAHANAVDDVSRITKVPLFFGWLPVGHGGTFSAPNGGDWAAVAVHWLDWQLKGQAEAGRWFSGQDCTLCRDQRWTIEHPVTR